MSSKVVADAGGASRVAPRSSESGEAQQVSTAVAADGNKIPDTVLARTQFRS